MRVSPPELFTLEGCEFEIKAETEMALLVVLGFEEMWLPRSQVFEVSPSEGKIVMTAWLAKKKGLL